MNAGINSPFTVVVLIPLYNEEKNVAAISEAISKVFDTVANAEYKILFVDDGSKDATLNVIKQLAAEDKKVAYISFSKNFGKEAALLAGFQNIPSAIDAVITIDADMQHPPSLIPTLIKHWQSGNDVVYTYREKSMSTYPFLPRQVLKCFIG